MSNWSDRNNILSLANLVKTVFTFDKDVLKLKGQNVKVFFWEPLVQCELGDDRKVVGTKIGTDPAAERQEICG